MRPLSRSKKRSSRLTTVDLPAPERPTRPIFSPGGDLEREAVEHAALAAVVEVHVVEGDRAGAHGQRLRVGAVDQPQRLRDRQHALLHDADLLEDFGDREGDPARHVGQLIGQRQHHGDGADLDRTSAPQQQRERACAGHQQRVEHREDGAEGGNQALAGEEAAGVMVDRVANVVVLVARPGEQLHRQDVGVAVDDPAHQRRARLGGDLRAVAHARHEVDQQRQIAREPSQHRNGEPAVGRGHHHDRGHAVDDDVPDRGDG